MQPPDLPEIPTGDINDPEWYPVQPEPPDGIFDALSYIVEMIIYGFWLIVYLLRAVVLGVGNIISGMNNLVVQIKTTLDFLPTELLVILGLSMVALVILKLIRR